MSLNSLVCENEWIFTSTSPFAALAPPLVQISRAFTLSRLIIFMFLQWSLLVWPVAGFPSVGRLGIWKRTVLPLGRGVPHNTGFFPSAINATPDYFHTFPNGPRSAKPSLNENHWSVSWFRKWKWNPNLTCCPLLPCSHLCSAWQQNFHEQTTPLPDHPELTLRLPVALRKETLCAPTAAPSRSVYSNPPLWALQS